MTFLLHNEEGISFPPIRPAYEEGQLLFDRFRTLTPRDAKDSIIGEGGTGLIHLVRDELMDRIVALKLPHENILRDPSARYDVIRETRQAIELTHPNIVRIHDFHEGPGSWGISMQYVRGKNLDEWRHEGRNGSRRSIVPYSVERIEGWIGQLCNALMYAHEDAHMVHRDIKPKNLMLERRDDGYEKLLLTDFGITQKIRLHTIMLSRVQPGSNEKSTMGTLPYMPWEQIQGAPASILDDIYSVGATIYELLTGRPPFYEGAYEQIRTQVEKVVPPSMTDRLQQFDLAIHTIPDHWEETVAACLAKRPEERPQSVREIMERLCLASGAPVAAAVEEPVPVISSAVVDTLQADLRLREDEVRTLQAELGARQSEVGVLQAQLQDASVKIASLEQTIEDSRLALGNAEGLDSERQQLLASLRAEVEEKGRQFAEATGQRDQLQATLATLEHQVQTAEQNRASLEAQLASAMAMGGAAQNDAAAQISEIERSAAERIQQAEAGVAAKIAATEQSAEERVQRAEASASTRTAEIEQAAKERIRQAETNAASQVEEARRTAADATEMAEKAARKKTAHALAKAVAAAEIAKQQAAKLAEDARRHAAAADRAEKELALLKSTPASSPPPGPPGPPPISSSAG